MENLFVTFEIAKNLQELGFDEPCLAYFIRKELHIYSHIVEFDGVNAPKLDVKNSKLTENHKAIYGIDVTAPLWQQATDWFRETYRINIESNYLPNIQKYRSTYKPMDIIPKEYPSFREYAFAAEIYFGKTNYDSHVEALKEGIEEAIKIVKELEKS